jgi:3-phenylpropionate/cinnamic acid dioxygenase small subunit
MDRESRDLVEKERVAGVIHRLFAATDARDWAGVRGCFAESVLFDMTSVAGGEPETRSPEQITAAWESALAPMDAVHHQTGNMVIELTDAEAKATCYGIAYHYRETRFGRNTRVFVGSYDFHLRPEDGSWKIDLFRFRLKFIDGNLGLEKEPPA